MKKYVFQIEISQNGKIQCFITTKVTDKEIHIVEKEIFEEFQEKIDDFIKIHLIKVIDQWKQ